MRRSERVFVIEGVRLAEEALAAGCHARQVIYTNGLSQRGLAALGGFKAQDVPVDQVSDSVMKAVSDTQTPQGLLVVLDWLVLPLPDRLDFVFIPDQMRDPGNLGTMLRTASAAGVQAVFLPPGTADAFGPKTLRSGMGAHFHLPIREFEWDEISSLLQGLTIYLAEARQGIPYYRADFQRRFALLVGSEAEGASQRARQLASELVQIPMPGKSESLNAAVAAGILLFEAARQRPGTPE